MEFKAECAWEIGTIIIQSSDMKIDLDLSLEQAKKLLQTLMSAIDRYEDLERSLSSLHRGTQ